MENGKNTHKQKNAQHLYWKYMFAVIVLLLLLTFVSIFMLFSYKPAPDKASEEIIRQVAAGIIGKDPNDLTNDYFATISFIYIQGKELCDIKLLEKFTNLQELDISDVHYPSNKIPKWMKILARLGIVDLSKRNTIDLSPITNMSNLEKLTIRSTHVKNIKPLKDLINLDGLVLNQTQVSDLEPLRRLNNLQVIFIEETQLSDIEPLKELINLQQLFIYNTQVSDFGPLAELINLRELSLQKTPISDLMPLKGLTNLEQLYLNETEVSNLEPLKSLTKLRMLNISHCKNVTDLQVEDLQKAMPELKIKR
jgi:Leucine-rich repeat (LRR) protein